MHSRTNSREVSVPSLNSLLLRATITAALSFAACVQASAQDINAALKDLAAAANREGTLTLSWSGSTLSGIQGAARYQAAINKYFGTNIRINFLPGADMARIINTLATEYSAGQKASVDIALGAAPQVVPVLTADFFESADWKKYLPNRITDELVECHADLGPVS